MRRGDSHQGLLVRAGCGPLKPGFGLSRGQFSEVIWSYAGRLPVYYGNRGPVRSGNITNPIFPGTESLGEQLTAAVLTRATGAQARLTTRRE